MFHILLFLCPGRLLFSCLLLPDAFLPPFQALLYGRFLSRLGGLAVLFGWQHLVEPVAHVTEYLHVCLNRFQFLPLSGQGGGKLFPFGFQIFTGVGIAFQVGFQIPDSGVVSVQFLPVALRKLLLFLFPADGGILRMDWLGGFVLVNVPFQISCLGVPLVGSGLFSFLIGCQFDKPELIGTIDLLLAFHLCQAKG